MTDLVPRTVTEIGEDGRPVRRQTASDDFVDWGDVLAGDDSTNWVEVLSGEDSGSVSAASQTLADFRDSDAYVLLGAPGAGKTELFKAEGKHEGCHYVTARDFLTFDVERSPEWHGTTLFIDGLDEKRAGSPDTRTPLDDIRAKLDALGCPRFRLSCREADWFGSNDRTQLATVSKNREIRVLRLNPLTDHGIRELLNRRAEVDDADAFMDEARSRGIGYLLANPKNAEMLAKAVSGGTWPNTRKETFELACEELVQEPNFEHRLANRNRPGNSALLVAAQRLSALLLLTGRKGYDEFEHQDDSEYLGLESVSENDRTTLLLALQSKLFTSPDGSKSCRAPIHRQVVEFLGAGYLAKLIEEGFSVRRVLALMTGEDGGVVSELRGLAAWLAAHSPRARPELIERDPEGVAAYGDAGVFTQGEKRRLLERLRPLGETLDASVFTSLATPDMAPTLVEYLADRNQGEEHPDFVASLTCVVARAAPVPGLEEVLYDVAADDVRPEMCRRWASLCLAMDATKQPERYGSVVRRLLNGLLDGRIRDDRNRILGELLQVLYPSFVGPDEVFRYWKTDRRGASAYGSSISAYESFWRHDLAGTSRAKDLQIVLDEIGDIFDHSDTWKLTGEPPDAVLAQAAGHARRESP